MLKNTPIVVSEYALARGFKAFAMRLGLDATLAEAVSQVHLAQSGLPLWSTFFQSNCGECTKDPETCDYLNPTQAQCKPGQSLVDLRAAVAQMIETRRVLTCPAKTRKP